MDLKAVNPVTGYVNTDTNSLTFIGSWPTILNIADLAPGLFNLGNDSYYNNGTGQFCKVFNQTTGTLANVLARPYNPVYVGLCDPPPGNFKINGLSYTADSQGNYCRTITGGQNSDIDYMEPPINLHFTGYCGVSFIIPTITPMTCSTARSRLTTPLRMRT